MSKKSNHRRKHLVREEVLVYDPVTNTLLYVPVEPELTTRHRQPKHRRSR